MRKLLLLLFLLPLAAHAQTKTGATLGFDGGPKDANGCTMPNPNYLLACIYSNGAIKISAYGSPYADPTNMLTSPFSLTFEPVVVGPVGSQPTIQNIGTPSAQDWKITIPAAPAAQSFTSFNCSSFSGVPSIGPNGVWTFSQAAGTGCTFK